MRISDWSSDVCSSDLAQIGKFADLDRRAERARAQFELQPFLGIARDRLDDADDREIERRERNRRGDGNAHQPPETQAPAFEPVKFARRRKPSEREETPEPPAYRNAERKKLGEEIRSKEHT